MADATRRDEVTRRRIYTLHSPTNWVEVSKTLSWVKQDLEALGIKEYDDTVTVEAWDDEIRFSFVLPSEAGA
jgi:hypothetical protein